MIYKLKDICFKITDGSHNPPTGIESSNYLMLSSKNIFDDLITFDSPRYLSEDDYILENKRTDIQNGDLLVTIVGTIGRVAVVKDIDINICLQRSVAVLKPNQDIVDSRYLMYQIQNMRPLLESEANGVAQKGIYLKQLQNIELQILDLDSQHKIVYVLDYLSRIIEYRKQQLSKLDELVKSRFIEMFGDTVLNPYNWNKEPLGKVCDVRDGTHDSPKYYDTGYPLVTSKNLSSGDIDFTDCSLICKNDFDKINERSKVDFGDILMPMIGTVGNPVIVKIKNDFAIKNVALIKFYNDTRVTNVYVQALLKSDYFDSVVLGKVRGGTQKFISLGDIRKLNILVPPIDLQNEFANFVEQTEKLKLEVKESLEKLETLKKSLMQKYFG